MNTVHPLLKGLLQGKPSQGTAGTSSTQGQSPQPAVLALRQAAAQAWALFQAQRFEAARLLLEEAKVLELRDVSGMHLLAVVSAQCRDFDRAEAVWTELLAMPEQEAKVLPNLGRMLEQTGQLKRAHTMLKRAVQLLPQDYTSHVNLSVCLQRMGLPEEAIEHCEKAVALMPGLARPWFNLGRIRQELHELSAAQDCYRKALAIDPTMLDAYTNLLFTQHYGERFDPMAQRVLAQELATSVCRSFPSSKPPPAGQDHDGALRVGLLSGDFKVHPVGWFLSGFLPLVDKTRIELIGYDNSSQSDDINLGLRKACAHWHSIWKLNDDDATELIRSHKLDVLVDLSGLTSGNRLGILIRKPVALQVSWLGYFGTTGLPSMDYLLADPYCVPQGEESLYVEKIWRLPHTRFCMAPPPQAPQVGELPALAKGQVTLGSFQDLHKLNDQVLQLWARVFAQLPQAQLRIQSQGLSQPRERLRMQERLAAVGLPAQQIVLLGATDRLSYLGAHAEVDFILDSNPYTGGTTTCEALWMGVPTLTLARPGMLGRQGQAHLTNLGLNEWIARDEEEFVALALRHSSAEGLQSLALLRGQLRQRCQSSPLFDNAQFATDWANALLAMHRTSLLPQD